MSKKGSFWKQKRSRNCEKSFGVGKRHGSSGKGNVETFLNDTIGIIVPSTKEYKSRIAGINAGRSERLSGCQTDAGSHTSTSNPSDVGSSGDYRESSGGPRSESLAIFFGWLVGIGFVLVAPPILVPIVVLVYPQSVHWQMDPLLAIPVLILFPFGPAILIGRAVARGLK